MQTKDAARAQLKDLLKNHPNISIDILYLYVAEFQILHELLNDNEVIHGYCLGLLEGSNQKYKAGNWLVVLTNQRFLFVNKAKIQTTYEQFSLELDQIKKLTTKMGWFFGQIQFETESKTIRMIQIGKKDYEFFVPRLKSYL